MRNNNDRFSYLINEISPSPAYSNVGGIGLEKRYQIISQTSSFGVDLNDNIKPNKDKFKRGDTISGRETQIKYKRAGAIMFDRVIEIGHNKYIWKKDVIEVGVRSYSADGYNNASGNIPPFKVGEKDPFPKKGSEGNIGDLQRALNKLGASPILTDDGIFGTKTRDAITKLGYKYSSISGLSSNEFYKILEDANKGDAEEVSLTDMKKLWEKDKGKYGKLSSNPDFDKWLKRQKTLAGIKDFGKGLFQVGLDWLRQKQTGATPMDEDFKPADTTRAGEIWGMPATAVYIGGAVLGLGLIIGIVALATRKPKQIIMQQPIPTA